MRKLMALCLLGALAACTSGGDSSSSSGGTSGGSTTTGGTTGGTSTTGSSTGTSGSNCSVIGQWTGTYSCAALNGDQYVWDIQDGGTAVGRISSAGFNDTVGQTWSYDGATFTIVDVSDSAGGQVCSMPGTYTLSFDAACDAFDMQVISDPCQPGRGSCVPGLHVTRTDGGL